MQIEQRNKLQIEVFKSLRDMLWIEIEWIIELYAPMISSIIDSEYKKWTELTKEIVIRKIHEICNTNK